jgi:L-ascorbate metabolism protein UlaG (beta-lactamase superfamily)
MKIRYLGHSCFVLTESTGTSIVTDPYGDVGFDLPRVSADVVTVSHSHYDHDNAKAVEGNPVVLKEEGNYEIGGVHISAIRCWHDDENGAKRGENLIFKFGMDGLEICHLGDIGEACTSELLEALLPIHVLLIPVGGNYTIDAEQAKEYVDRIMPSVVIPMHYKTRGLNLDLDKVSEFTDLFDDEEVEEIVDQNETEVEFFRDDISDDSTKIIIMERDTE